MDKYTLQYENECFCLGSFLKDASLLEETILQPLHFMDPHNRRVFQLMTEIIRNGEVVSVFSFAKLGISEMQSFGGMDHISQLLNSVSSLHAFDAYQKAIIDFHSIQEATNIAQGFLEMTKERHHIKDFQQFIHDVTEIECLAAGKTESFKELLANRYSYHQQTPEKGLSGTNTGFMCVNQFTDGWQKGDLIIIAGRPSMGKTAFVLNSMLNGSKKDGIFTSFFSIEMAKGQVVDRFIAMSANINLMKMRNPNKTFGPEEWQRYTKAIGDLETLPIDIRGDYTVPGIRAAVRKNMKQYPDEKHVVAIDFLTLIKHTDPSGNTHKDVTDIIQDLKQMAKDLDVPVLVLAQHNRGVEQRQDKRPTMSDIRESGSIEQIADLILFLYRDEYYHRDTSEPGITEIIIAKNRNGATGQTKLCFSKQTNIFREVII